MISFSKYANLYFSISRKIIEAANKSGYISECQLNDIAREYGISEDNYDFINALIGKANKDNKFHGICILEPAGVKTYRSIISNLPLILSLAERTALAESLTSDIAPAFISKKTLEKLSVMPKTTMLTETLDKVVTAIKTDKWIEFDNKTADGTHYSGQHLKPQKIETSLMTGEYFVSGHCKETSRLIKCKLNRITINAIEDGETVDTDSELVQKRCPEPIRLSIENHKNAIDRAFNMFSGYEKDGFYDKKDDRYSLDIYYYMFEERILIEKILSLGSAAVVISPADIKGKIIERVKAQLNKLT